MTRIAFHVALEYRPMVWIGAPMGLRWSEVAGLRVGRIDLTAGRLSVAEAIVRGKGGRNVFGPPKSKAGHRTMFMPRAITTMLEAHQEHVGLTPQGHRGSGLHRRSGRCAALFELASPGLAAGRQGRRLRGGRLPRSAAPERHDVGRRGDRREDGPGSSRARRPEDDPRHLRLGRRPIRGEGAHPSCR